MIEVTFEGLEGVYRTLGIITEGVTDLHEPIHLGLRVLSESVLDHLIAGIEPDILPESRDGRKFDKETPPLWDSGETATAATATWDGTPGSTYELTPEFGQIGVDPLFHGARRHQLGFGIDKLGRTFREPAREFLVWRDGDRIVVRAVFETYLGSLLATGVK